MPVQINEMIIRANIVEPNAGENANTNNTQQAQQSASESGGAVNKDEIIKECAALVMEILNNKNQR